MTVPHDLVPPAIIQTAEDLASLAAVANAEHEAARRSGRAALDHARKAGEYLAKVQRQLKEDRRWLAWLRDAAKIPERMAQRYLEVYNFGPIPDTVSDMGLRESLEFIRSAKELEADQPLEAATDVTPGTDKTLEIPQPKTRTRKNPNRDRQKASPADPSPEQDELEPDEEDARCDEVGIPADDRTLPILDAAGTIDALLKSARELKKQFLLIVNASGGERLRDRCRVISGKFEHAKFQEFITDLKFFRPHCVVCPWCHAAHPGEFDRDCKACYGAGWVNKNDWESALPEDRQAVLELAKGGAQ